MSMEAVGEFARLIWGPWLMIVFVGIVAWAFWPKNKQKMEQYGRIPLDDDEQGGAADAH